MLATRLMEFLIISQCTMVIHTVVYMRFYILFFVHLKSQPLCKLSLFQPPFMKLIQLFYSNVDGRCSNTKNNKSLFVYYFNKRIKFSLGSIVF